MDYRDLFDTDSSHLAFVENGFDTVKESIVSEISEEANSGCWVRLSDGSVVFLEQDPDLGDETVDTDKDGIPDIYELSDKYYSEYNFRGYKIPVETWRFYSNPSDDDTDGDGIGDNDDFYPNGFDTVITTNDDKLIQFNSGRTWNILPCSTGDYIQACLHSTYAGWPIINLFYPMPDGLNYQTYYSAMIGVAQNLNSNDIYSTDELCLISMLDPYGIPLYADDMCHKVSSQGRTEIVETILNRPIRYYRHESDDTWKLLQESDDRDGGFFKGVVLSEADLNLTIEPYRAIDMDWILEQTVKAFEIISFAYFFIYAVPLVAENMAALIGYIKLYGFGAGLKWYMQLGTYGFPDGAISWLKTEHPSNSNIQLTQNNIQHIKKHTFLGMSEQAKHLTDEQLGKKLSTTSFFNKAWTDEEVVRYTQEAYNILRAQNKVGLNSVEIHNETIFVFIKDNGVFDTAYGVYKYSINDFR